MRVPSTLHPGVFLCAVLLLLTGCEHRKNPESADGLTRKEQLGKLLFHDRNLSTPPGQACVDCHDPEAGFGNPDATLPVSRGVHRDRFGNRNDLTAAYSAHTPEFHLDSTENIYVGGFFWDGRAATLAEQAKGPPTNPLEMANRDEEAVVESIRRSEYADLFREVFGTGSLTDPLEAYELMAEAIAAFESTREFNRFDSKYDFYLQDRAELTEEESRGLQLFEDPGKGNCAACHPSQPGPDGSPPLFTDYTYDNLGVPQNPANPFLYMPADLNPDGPAFVDLGLGGVLNDPAEHGKFKVPTLRNIGLTAPYMHNGIFPTLREVVLFYSTRDIGPWPPPEVKENVNTEELGDLGLTSREIDDIVAFLKTLDDGYTPGSQE
ncbi:MAG: cytochrome-c peroxidase [Bacteroidota bacterium]